SDYRVWASGLYRRRPEKQGHQGCGEAAFRGSRRYAPVSHRRAFGNFALERKTDVSEFGLVFGRIVPPDGRADLVLYATVRHFTRYRLERARYRTARRRQNNSPERKLRGSRKQTFCSAREAVSKN